MSALDWSRMGDIERQLFTDAAAQTELQFFRSTFPRSAARYAEAASAMEQK